MKHLFTAILLASSISAYADDFSLYYDLTSGEKNTEASAVADLQKIVFDKEGNMILHKKDGSTQNVDISNVSRIFFSTPTAVDIEAVKSDEPIINKGVYDLCGRKLNVNPDNETLPRGIYIINGKKVQVK